MEVTRENIDEIYPDHIPSHSLHRRPYEAGDSDRYYDRPPRPNYSLDGRRIFDCDMEPWQIEEYWRGYQENPTGRKEW